jgi:hypothetical protein
MLRKRSLRTQPDRLTTLKRGSIRGLQSILSLQSGVSPYSSNSSIDGRISPSPSFATSTHEVRTFIIHFCCGYYSRIIFRGCMVQVLPSLTPPLALLQIYHIRSSGKHRKTMIEVYAAKDPALPLLVFRMKSWLCSVRLGQKKAFFVANSTGNP